MNIQTNIAHKTSQHLAGPLSVRKLPDHRVYFSEFSSYAIFLHRAIALLRGKTLSISFKRDARQKRDVFVKCISRTIRGTVKPIA